MSERAATTTAEELQEALDTLKLHLLTDRRLMLDPENVLLVKATQTAGDAARLWLGPCRSRSHHRRGREMMFVSVQNDNWPNIVVIAWSDE